MGEGDEGEGSANRSPHPNLQATAIHMGVAVEQDKLDPYVVPA